MAVVQTDMNKTELRLGPQSKQRVVGPSEWTLQLSRPQTPAS